MNPARVLSWIVAACLFSASFLGAAERAKSGTVKGTITIAGKPTQDVIVSVEGVDPKQMKADLANIKAKRAVMDQRGMKFIPLVLPVVAGTTVDFPNNDKTFHNVYSKGGAKNFDLGLYPAGQTRSTTFEQPGVARILCNAHPNMEAFIVVKEHPYFSAADSRGNYEIKDVPLGKARLEIWHPTLGTRTVPVNVSRAGEVIALDIDLKKQ
jgi:plastocyanin